MKRLTILFNFVVMLCLLAACAAPAQPTAPGGSGKPQPTAIEISEKPRNPNPSSSPADLQKLVSGNNAFAFALHQALLGSNSGNLFYSPYSISVALAMAQAGASGDTLAQMNAAMHYGLTDSALHQAFNALQLALARREKNADQPNTKDFQLNVANSIWGQAGFNFKPAYLDLLGENYGAGMRLVDFQAAAESARQLINDWVAQQTAQKIKDLIPQGGVNDMTRLVLANAIYFNAAWMYTFDAGSTQNASFTNLDGKQVSVPMMNQQHDFAYAKGSGYQAVELPYAGGKLSMLVLVPDTGQFAAIEKTLDPALLDAIQKNMNHASVMLSLPKFKVESTFALGDVLQKMGMKDAFDSAKADFSGMDGAKDLYISSVVHKSYVSVDENGTEAAAATAVMVGVTSMPVEVVELKIDRPFLFVIRDNESGAILFAGRVVSL